MLYALEILPIFIYQETIIQWVTIMYYSVGGYTKECKGFVKICVNEVDNLFINVGNKFTKRYMAWITNEGYRVIYLLDTF